MRPIFVGGCGRSGTTLVASLLGGHPQAVTPPEAQFLVGGLSTVSRLPEADRGAAFLRFARGDWRLALWELPDGAGDDGAATPADAMASLATAYAGQHGRPEAGYWVDHSPHNILYARTLLGAFPESVMLHVVRDPRGVAASVLPLDWGPASPREAARWWMGRIAAGLAAEAALGERVLRVTYEGLVADPRATLQRICDHAGLPFSEAMLAEPSFDQPGYTRDQHALVGLAPEPSRAAAWRRSLSPTDVAIIESEVADTLPLLGYEPAGPSPAVHRPRGSREAAGSLLRTGRQRVAAYRRRTAALRRLRRRKRPSG